MEKRPLISVIVPLYNREEYLREAIESVLKQTYTHWELILVDDGSTDNSGLICDEYSHKDSRIHVYHQVNKGTSAARNTGMQYAKGEWLYFLDSDDWIEDHALETLLQYSENADVVMGRYPVANHEYFILTETLRVFFLKDLSDQERLALYRMRAFMIVCDKLYRRSSIHDTFDSDSVFCADTCFNLKQLEYWNKFIMLPVQTYHYRLGHISLSRKFKLGRIWEERILFEQYRAIFGDINEVMEHCSLQYVSGLMDYDYCCVNTDTYTHAQKMLFIQISLETDGFDNSRILTGMFNESQRKFWNMVLDSDAEGIYQMMSTIQLENVEKEDAFRTENS